MTLRDGKLTVQANNSGLNQILLAVAAQSGMTIDGLSDNRDGKDARVFGQYGPDSPSEVLTELLDDSGYNFMMVGVTTRGAPRSLLLTARKDAALAVAAANPAAERAAEAQTPVPTGNYDTESREHTLQRLEHLHEQQQAQENSPR